MVIVSMIGSRVVFSSPERGEVSGRPSGSSSIMWFVKLDSGLTLFLQESRQTSAARMIAMTFFISLIFFFCKIDGKSAMIQAFSG